MTFKCPKCNKAGVVDDSKVPEIGVYATCPLCNNKFLIKREATNTSIKGSGTHTSREHKGVRYSYFTGLQF